jgi:hypothetical protein
VRGAVVGFGGTGCQFSGDAARVLRIRSARSSGEIRQQRFVRRPKTGSAQAFRMSTAPLASDVALLTLPARGRRVRHQTIAYARFVRMYVGCGGLKCAVSAGL